MRIPLPNQRMGYGTRMVTVSDSYWNLNLNRTTPHKLSTITPSFRTALLSTSTRPMYFKCSGTPSTGQVLTRASWR
jgi:hypothetical protein